MGHALTHMRCPKRPQNGNPQTNLYFFSLTQLLQRNFWERVIDNRKFAFQNCEPCEDFVWTLFYPCDSTVQRRETQFNDVLRDDMHLKYDNFEVFEI